MARLLTSAAAAAVLLAAGACAPRTGELSATNNPSIYSVHQPVVERTDFVLDLSTDGSGVPAAEIERLHAWFDSIELRYGDRISVDQDAYASEAARRDVAAALAEYGLLLTPSAPITAGAVPPGAIRVVASRAMASVPSCPVWSETGAAPRQNTSSNFGCSTNSNLAAMVANPEDLVLGQGGSVASSGATASRAIRVYREGQPTGRQGLPQTSTTGNR